MAQRRHNEVEINKVDQSEIELCTKVFSDYDSYGKGWISANTLEMALQKVGIEFSHSNVFHKMVSELENQSGRLSFSDFMRIYIEFKKQEKNENELREEALNAYVAMGGEENGEGNKSHLIKYSAKPS